MPSLTLLWQVYSFFWISFQSNWKIILPINWKAPKALHYYSSVLGFSLFQMPRVISHSTLQELLVIVFMVIILKTHILEAHVVEFLNRQTGVFKGKGLGFWSEQASESVHYDWYKLWVDNKYKRELDHKDYNKQLLKCGVTYNSRHLK